MFDPRRLFRTSAGRLPPAQAALRADPTVRLALVDLSRGRASTALATFDAAIAERRFDVAAEAELRNKRGVALVNLGRRGEALAAFVDALACDERCAAALVNVGNLLLEDGATLDAIDFYNEAVAADPASASAHRGLGVAYKKLGNRGASVRALRAESRHAARRPGT